MFTISCNVGGRLASILILFLERTSQIYTIALTTAVSICAPLMAGVGKLCRLEYILQHSLNLVEKCGIIHTCALFSFLLSDGGPFFSFSASPLSVPSPGPPGTVPYCFFPFLKTPDSVKLNLPRFFE